MAVSDRASICLVLAHRSFFAFGYNPSWGYNTSKVLGGLGLSLKKLFVVPGEERTERLNRADPRRFLYRAQLGAGADQGGTFKSEVTLARLHSRANVRMVAMVASSFQKVRTRNRRFQIPQSHGSQFSAGGPDDEASRAPVCEAPL